MTNTGSMRVQRKFMLCYFLAAVTVFYTAYYYAVIGRRPSLAKYSVEHYRNKEPKRFTQRIAVYHDKADRGSTQRLAEAVVKLLKKHGVDAGARELAAYKYAAAVGAGNPIEESFDDMLDLSAEMVVVLRHERQPAFKGQFELKVHGGNALVFALTTEGIGSKHMPEKVAQLTRALFFRYDGMPSTNITPLLDVSFVLMSDRHRVAWNVKEDILATFFHPIANALSLIYDISLHSRTISGANLTAEMKTKTDPGSGDHDVVDIQEQEHPFFDVLERVTSVEVATRDSTIYRHALALVCHVPHRPLRFYDRALKRTTDAVTIKGMGILSMLDPPQQSEGEPHEYRLGREDTARLAGTWTTHIRRMHNLPPTPLELVAEALEEQDSFTRLGDRRFAVKSTALTFEVSLEQPGLGAFYGFELAKIARSMYRLYHKGALDNLQKVVKPLATISVMTRVSDAAVVYTQESHGALKCLHAGACRQTPKNNAELLALARTAFKQALEAMGDDETYAKGAVSMEHGIAAFMCDVFPFVFPILANGMRYIKNK